MNKMDKMDKKTAVTILVLTAIAVVSLAFHGVNALANIRENRATQNVQAEPGCFEYRQTYLMLLTVRSEWGMIGTEYEHLFTAFNNSFAAAQTNADLDAVLGRMPNLGLLLYDPVSREFVTDDNGKRNVTLSDIDKLRAELNNNGYDVTNMDQQVAYKKYVFDKELCKYVEKHNGDKEAAEKFRTSVLGTGVYHFDHLEDYSAKYWN